MKKINLLNKVYFFIDNFILKMKNINNFILKKEIINSAKLLGINVENE